MPKLKVHYLDILLSMRFKLVVIIFLIGLCLRLVVFIGPHTEGDELIYMTLVEQLNSGKGYTLQGSPLLEQGVIDKTQYNHPLFFHPPGGIALYWLFRRLFGLIGYPLVQILSYIIFFWSMILLAKAVKLSSSNIGLALVAGLSAFNPIMSHVTTKIWLDGPLLAFTTLAVAVYAWAIEHDKHFFALIAGVLLGYASLIKITAFLVIPGVALMTWIVLGTTGRVHIYRFLMALLIPAIIIQLPWEIWQWIVLGSPFPSWAGRPSESLIHTNKYIFYLTVVRSPWIYLTLTPRIVWTLLPSCFLYFLFWGHKSIRQMGLPLAIWILTVIFAHIMLGFMGYSKLVRYIILITPASIMLFSLLMVEATEYLRSEEITSIKKTLVKIVCGVSVVAFFMEIAAGIYAVSVFYNDLIVPIIGAIW